MKNCESCEMRGYSRELCAVHIRHCRKHPGGRPTPEPARLGARVAGGLAIGATAALLVSTAVSFVVGAAVFQSLMPTLVVGSGIVGGGWGLVRSFGRPRSDLEVDRTAPPRPRRGGRSARRTYP